MITKQEVSLSQTAVRKNIDNTIPDSLFSNAIELNENIVQAVRKQFPDVYISSWYRSPKLNKAIGGSPTSQHMEGRAVDLIGKDNTAIFHFIKDNLPFDQLIWEFGDKAPAWVHVSYDEKKNRKQALKAVRLKTKTIYKIWK